MIVQENRFENVAEIIERSMADNKVAGAALSVIKGGTVVHTSTYGIAEPEGNIPVSEGTHFEAASLTKPVFVRLVYKLSQKGLIDVSMPMSSYSMNQIPSDDPAFLKATAKDAMCHRTGLPNWGNAPLPIAFEPGTGFSYSGKGYTYLQNVVEELAGHRVDILLQSEIFNPLGMEDAAMIWTGPLNRTLSRTFDSNGEIEPKRDKCLHSVGFEPNVAFTLHVTIKDYPKFVIDIMSDKEFLDWVRSDTNHAADGVDWGLGWGLTREIFWHWGDNGGFKSFVCFDPETGDGIMMHTNSFNGLHVCYDTVQHLTDFDMTDIRTMIANAE